MAPFLTEGTTSSDEIEWGTPDSLYQPANELYRFTLDLAASHANAKAERYCTPDGTFGPDRCMCVERAPKYTILAPLPHETRDDHLPGCPKNGLLVQTDVGPRRMIDWRDGTTFPLDNESTFVNPPWGDEIVAFLRHIVAEHLRARALVYGIFPARMDTAWFHDYVRPWARWEPSRGRPKFIDPQAGEREQRRAAALAIGDKEEADRWKPRTQPPVGVIKAVYR